MHSPRTLLFRTLGFGALLASLALAVPGCISPPDYSDTPEIEFRNVSMVRVQNRFGLYDSVTVVIGYRDGDGDLGLGQDDMDPPFNPTLPDKSVNPTYNNYFCQLQIRQSNGSFLDFDPPGLNYNFNGRYPVLTPSSQGDRKAPLRGDINYGFPFSRNPFTPPGTVVRFKISILDRALNRSNEVFTSPVTVSQ